MQKNNSQRLYLTDKYVILYLERGKPERPILDVLMFLQPSAVTIGGSGVFFLKDLIATTDKGCNEEAEYPGNL